MCGWMGAWWGLQYVASHGNKTRLKTKNHHTFKKHFEISMLLRCQIVMLKFQYLLDGFNPKMGHTRFKNFAPNAVRFLKCV